MHEDNTPITQRNKAFQEENIPLHNAMKAYFAMVRIAESLNWPENYQDDLYVHDYAYLASDNAPSSFGWVLRNNGTHIIDPHYNKNSWNAASLRRTFNGHIYKENECKFYWIADVAGDMTPAECTLNEFCQLFQSEHIRYYREEQERQRGM